MNEQKKGKTGRKGAKKPIQVHIQVHQ